MAKSHGEVVIIGSGAGFALKLVSQGVKFIMKTVFIYTLGMQYTGMSTLFGDILGMLALAEMGIGSTITFALYKPIRQGDHRRIGALMNFYKKAYRMIAAIVLAVGLALIPFLPYLVRDVPDIKESIALIFSLYVIENAATYLLAYKQTLLTASERRYVISKTGIWFTLVRTAMECAVLLLTKSFIAYLMVGIVESLLRNYVISRKADKHYPQLDQYHDEKLTKEETRRLLADVGAMSMYKIANVILGSTDSIVIASIPALGVLSVGYLGNYRLLFSTIDSFITQFYNSFTPSLGSMAASSSAEKQYKVFCTAYFASFWAVLFCTTSLLALAEPFVRNIWMGPKYVLSTEVLFALAFNFYVRCVMRPFYAFRNSNGLFVQGRFRPLATAALNLTLDVILVQVWGVFGVLMATGLSLIATQLWYDTSLVFRNVFKKPARIYAKTYISHVAVAIVSCATAYYGCRWLNTVIPNVYGAFLLQMLLCLIVPNALVVGLYHNTPEYKDLLGRLKNLTKILSARLKNKLRKKRGQA